MDTASKKMVNATVLSQERLTMVDTLYDMWLSLPEIAATAKEGQFISLYTNDASKLLPRPISICEVDREAGALRIIYRVTGEHTGTDEFSKLVKGDQIRVMGPLGNGFDIAPAKDKDVLVFGGGIGIFPMYELTKQLCQSYGAEHVKVILGYRSEPFFREEFAKVLGSEDRIITATEDGSFGTKGNVLTAIDEQYTKQGITAGGEDYVLYACGPKPMLRAIKAYAEETDTECYVSLEERMACGIGACLACVCQTTKKDHHSHVNNTRICKDGPVFNAKEVVL